MRLIFRKKSKLRIIFDAKKMRQSSMFWYLKPALNSLNKKQNKLVTVKEGSYNSFENGIEKLSLGQTLKAQHPICCSIHLYSIFSTNGKKRPEYHTNLISGS